MRIAQAAGTHKASKTGREGTRRIRVPGLHEFELGLDLHAVPDGPRHRTEIGVELEHTLGGVPVLFGKFQVVGDFDAPDHQHLAVLRNLAPDLGNQVTLLQPRAARFQRSGKGAGESAAGGGNHVVQGRRRRRKILGLDSVVLRDF